MNRHTLWEAYNFRVDVTSGVTGPFQVMQGLFPIRDLPWLTSAAKARELDYDYLGNYSGDKPCSPLVEKLIATNEYEYLDPSHRAQLAYMLFDICVANNVNKIWEALQTEYAPLENYSMTEEMTDDITEHEKGATNTRTYDTAHAKTGTETTTPDTEITAEGSVYGYDSSTPTPDNKSVTSTSGTNETEYDTSETDTGTVTDVGSGTDTDTRNYTLTRTGNIGVTTSQQMLESEINIRLYDFYRMIYKEFDKVLTIPIY